MNNECSAHKTLESSNEDEQLKLLLRIKKHGEDRLKILKEKYLLPIQKIEFLNEINILCEVDYTFREYIKIYKHEQ